MRKTSGSVLDSEPGQELASAAQAAYQAAAVSQAGESLAQFDAAILQAQAAIDLIHLQLTKLEVTAPVNGVALARNVEPGGVVTAGASVLVLGRLDDLPVTVFVDEVHYGDIRAGDRASVEADSFSGQVFEAKVTRIAEQAEFTPRNVQTEEGRRTTVFPAELSVVDSGGKLKPGMPVDVRFENQ